MSELHKFLFDGLPVRGMLVRLTDGWREVLRAAREPSRRLSGAGARAARRDGGGRRADAGQHQVQRRADPADLRRRAGQAGGGRGAARPEPSAPPPRWSARSPADARAARRWSTCTARAAARSRSTRRTSCRASSPTRASCRCTATSGEPLQQLSRGARALHAAVRAARHPAGAGGRRRGRRRPADPAPAGRGRGQPRTGAAPTRTRSAATRTTTASRMLAATLTRDELLTLDADTILRRLFWEETLRASSRSAAALRLHLLARARAAACCAAWAATRSTASSPSAATSRSAATSAACSTTSIAVDVGELFTPARDQPPARSMQ